MASVTPPLSVYQFTEGSEKPADLIFVHGLMGSATETWSCSAKIEDFWPKWLGALGNVWVVDYPADLFWWNATGASMALPERGRSILDILANYGIGRRPLVFVTHSLGGLLVKQMLRTAQDLNYARWKRILKNTRGVAFLGTPHTGSGLGSLAGALRVLGISTNATQLKSNEAHLLDLTSWYSKNAPKLGIRSLAYYEKGTVHGIKVVDEGSADPRVEDCNPVPSDENHINICKPKSTKDPVYMGVLSFIETLVCEPEDLIAGSVYADLVAIDNLEERHAGVAEGRSISTARDGAYHARALVGRLSGVAVASTFTGKIEAFLEEYLMSEEGLGVVPFAGRDKELELLDGWLDDTGGASRLVLTAPAGRGKSALIVHWMERLECRQRIGAVKRPFLPPRTRAYAHIPGLRQSSTGV